MPPLFWGVNMVIVRNQASPIVDVFLGKHVSLRSPSVDSSGLSMTSFMIFALFANAALGGPGVESAQNEESTQPGFRVRSDFAAALNSDGGWAGGLNENVTISADHPFRIRFEIVPGSGSAARQPYRLQYRRNAGDWTEIEAHDFPHPESELDLDFAKAEIGRAPEAWKVARGKQAGLSVAADGQRRVLRASADQSPLIGLYAPPWELPEFEFATQLRLGEGNRMGAGLIFGYVDAENYFRVFLDATGAIRVSRVANGSETVLVEKSAIVPSGKWLNLEIDFEGGELDVNYGEGLLEFTVKVGAISPTAPLGVYAPANGTAEFLKFAIVGQAKTPRVSIVSCPAYKNGAATSDLLKGSDAAFETGAGISLASRTPSWTGSGRQGEFEWAVVVRRFADGPVINEEGDTFEFRMVNFEGTPMVNSQNPKLRLTVPPGHVGGTFVETPGRIGPWQASNGELYFIMEPTETDNVFMMIKSSDNGRTWKEVDGANRPKTGDLESVDARQVGDTIHIIHQVTRSCRYHTFHTSDHPSQPDSWAIRDEQAGTANAIAQAASLVVRSDNSVVAFYVGQTKIHYNIRSSKGVWGQERMIDPDLPPNLAGPQAILGANDTVHLAYYGTDGTLWYRRLQPNGTLTDRQLLASGAGAERADYGAVLPLLFIHETNTAIILYRLASGELWERRIIAGGPPTPAAKVTDRKVVRSAVDSQQPGADAVLDRKTVEVLFIDQDSRSIFSTHDANGWQPGKLRVENIRGSWVRGSISTRKDGVKVYGFLYDAGSEGGSGMNRFGEIELSHPEN